ncbi:MAG: hypothetical protein MZV63_19845 [Marinilabiliales bacterium]|nr:hypothetical protein [Marinilabiliales bacterium]
MNGIRSVLYHGDISMQELSDFREKFPGSGMMRMILKLLNFKIRLQGTVHIASDHGCLSLMPSALFQSLI